MTAPMRLSTVDHEILRLLLIAPFQRAEDLGHLLALHPNLVLRHLAVLAHLDLVADITPGCLGRNTGRFAYLTPRGIALLATEAAIPSSRFAQRWQADLTGLARLLVRLPALAKLQAHLPEILRACDQALRDRYAPRTRTMPWYWVRNYTYTFSDAKTRQQIWTDGLVVIQPRLEHPHGIGLPNTLPLNYASWLLLDPGTGEADAFLGRLVALLRLREARRAATGFAAFPPVLIFATSAYRASIWRRAAQGAARKLQMEPLVGMIQIAPLINTDGWPPGQVSDGWCGPPGEREWSNLVSGEREPLQRLFHESLPLGALPPAIIPAPFATTSDQVVQAHALTPPRTYTAPLVERLDRSWQRGHQRPDSAMRLGRHLLALTRRQIQVLGILAAHPILPLAELSIILDVASTTCRIHYLGSLLEQGLIAHVALDCQALNARLPPLQRVANTEAVLAYHVTEVGLQLLAHLQHLPPGRLPSTQDTALFTGQPTARPGAQVARIGAHNVGIYRFFALLITAARAQGELHRLLWWETGSACTRRFAAGTAADGTIMWETIRPDAIAEYAWGTRRMRFWLEWDMGTMNTAKLMRKFINYSRYAHSRRFRQEGARSLPVLYVVTPDVGQENRVARILAALIAHGYLDPKGLLSVRTTTFALLAEHGPLPAIWRAQLPQPYLLATQVGTPAYPQLAMLDAVRPLPGTMP